MPLAEDDVLFTFEGLLLLLLLVFRGRVIGI